jgi:hypothetical protein
MAMQGPTITARHNAANACVRRRVRTQMENVPGNKAVNAILTQDRGFMGGFRASWIDITF